MHKKQLWLWQCLPPCVLGREKIGRVIPQLLVPIVTWYTNFSCLITETEKPSNPGELLLFSLLRPSWTMSRDSCLERSRPALRNRCSTPNDFR